MQIIYITTTSKEARFAREVYLYLKIWHVSVCTYKYTETNGKATSNDQDKLV